MICISDVHGNFKTLIKLLKKCPRNEEIIFLGDLVDRGPRSKQVIQFAIDNKIKCVKGNHDDLMVGSFQNKNLLGNSYQDIWVMNGAKETIDSYCPNFKVRTMREIRDLIPDEHIEFLENLPYYIEYDDVLLSHTGNGKIGSNDYEKIWERTLIDDPEDKRMRIFGHTPHDNVVMDSISINIDTGCAYKRYGTLTALRWPQMDVYQEKNCE